MVQQCRHLDLGYRAGLADIVHVEQEMNLLIDCSAARDREPCYELIKIDNSVALLVELDEEPFPQQTCDWEVLQEGLFVDVSAIGSVGKILPCLLKDTQLVLSD